MLQGESENARPDECSQVGHLAMEMTALSGVMKVTMSCLKKDTPNRIQINVTRMSNCTQ